MVLLLLELPSLAMIWLDAVVSRTLDVVCLRARRRVRLFPAACSADVFTPTLGLHARVLGQLGLFADTLRLDGFGTPHCDHICKLPVACAGIEMTHAAAVTNAAAAWTRSRTVRINARGACSRGRSTRGNRGGDEHAASGEWARGRRG